MSKIQSHTAAIVMVLRPWTLDFGPWTGGRRGRRPAFTLMELLVVIMILAIIAGMTMMALAGAAEQAREQRTRAIINKIDQLIREKYESYRTRAMPVRVPAVLSAQNPGGAIYSARIRLYALRELMRLELPDRISDLCTDPAELNDLQADNVLDVIANRNDARRNVLFTGVQVPMPAIAKNYKRQAQRIIAANGNGWSAAHQGAECLYLIISTMKDGDKSALDYFTDTEIGDTDEDGFKEILDGWGTPIEFLRWAPGYVTQTGADGGWGVAGTDDDGDGTTDNITEAGFGDDVAPSTLQTSNFALAPDPFDPIKCDPRWANSNAPQKPFALWPLIYSAGKDRAYDINVGTLVYSQTAGNTGNVVSWTNTPPSDPYFSASPMIGTPSDTNANSALEYGDNITNHYQAPP